MQLSVESRLPVPQFWHIIYVFILDLDAISFFGISILIGSFSWIFLAKNRLGDIREPKMPPMPAMNILTKFHRNRIHSNSTTMSAVPDEPNNWLKTPNLDITARIAKNPKVAESKPIVNPFLKFPPEIYTEIIPTDSGPIMGIQFSPMYSTAPIKTAQIFSIISLKDMVTN